MEVGSQEQKQSGLRDRAQDVAFYELQTAVRLFLMLARNRMEVRDASSRIGVLTREIDGHLEVAKQLRYGSKEWLIEAIKGMAPSEQEAVKNGHMDDLIRWIRDGDKRP